MAIERRVIRVTGLVQGVNYRREARREAERLGLRGFARNEPDGSVTVDVEGEPTALDRLIAWCRTGPDASIVERVEATDGPIAAHREFRIE